MSDPATYDEALEQGFRPLAAPGKPTGGLGITLQQLNKRKKQYLAEKGIDCRSAPTGTKCFDWTNDAGVRTICFCNEMQNCGNCVQKEV